MNSIKIIDKEKTLIKKHIELILKSKKIKIMLGLDKI